MYTECEHSASVRPSFPHRYCDCLHLHPWPTDSWKPVHLHGLFSLVVTLSPVCNNVESLCPFAMLVAHCTRCVPCSGSLSTGKRNKPLSFVLPIPTLWPVDGMLLTRIFVHYCLLPLVRCGSVVFLRVCCSYYIAVYGGYGGSLFSIAARFCGRLADFDCVNISDLCCTAQPVAPCHMIAPYENNCCPCVRTMRFIVDSSLGFC